MDEGAAMGNGSNDGKEGKIIDIETREGHGVDFVDGGDEVGFFDVKVDETGAVVGREVLRRFVDDSVHAF